MAWEGERKRTTESQKGESDTKNTSHSKEREVTQKRATTPTVCMAKQRVLTVDALHMHSIFSVRGSTSRHPCGRPLASPPTAYIKLLDQIAHSSHDTI